MTDPRVTVAVVCYNEEENISLCLDSILNQDTPELFSILVIDGGSRDGTLQLLNGYVKKYPNVRIVHNQQQTVSSGRNVAINTTTTTLLAFTDADCVVPVNWLRGLLTAFDDFYKKDPQLVAVGGGNIPPCTTPFYRALSVFLSSYFGNRNSVQAKLLPEYTLINHIPTLNIMYLKDAIKQIGGFDESFGNAGEDEDLNFRLIATGGRIIYSPHCTIIHKNKSDLVSWTKNMWRYGVGRVWLMKKHSKLRKPIFCLPLLVLMSILLAGFSVTNPVLLIPMLVYITFFIILSGWLAYSHDEFCLWDRILVMFFVTHVGYALGMLWGMTSTSRKG